ncbi:uncharacterized protein [Amphiura filiformis]|uniref:uncharacterized protein n=1 Tax=Amphiura filiformis TaxID=82378 RepID=UPI003B2271B1
MALRWTQIRNYSPKNLPRTLVLFATSVLYSVHLITCQPNNFILVTDLPVQQVDSKIWQGDLANSDLPLTGMPITGAILRTPAGISYDDTNNKVYWTDCNDHKLNRANYDGTNREEFTVSTCPVNIGLDTANQKMYWANEQTATIQMADYAIFNNPSSVVTTLYTVTQGMTPTRVWGIAVYLPQTFLFWSQWGGDPSIWRYDLGGTLPTICIITATGGFPTGITIDHDQEDVRLYWLDRMLNKIQSTDLSGQYLVTLYENNPQLVAPFGVGIFGKYIYWSDFNWQNIFRINKYTGVEPESVGPNVFRRAGAIYIHKANPGISQCSSCCSNNGDLLTVSPSSGSMLGGDLLVISGACNYPSVAMITCEFDTQGNQGMISVEGDAVDLSNGFMDLRCVTPTVFLTGRIPLSVSFLTMPGGTQITYNVIFTFINAEQIPPLVTRDVSVDWPSLSTFDIMWDTSIFNPSAMVIIDLLVYKESSPCTSGMCPSLSVIANLGNNVNYNVPSPWPYTFSEFNAQFSAISINGGITLPSALDNRVGIIRVSDLTWTASPMHPRAIWSDVHSLEWLLERTPSSSTWCRNTWATLQPNWPIANMGNDAPKCPCTQTQASRDFGRFHPHPDKVHCVRATHSSSPSTNSGDSPGTGQECCYDGGGTLLNVRDITITTKSNDNGQTGGGYAHRYHHAGISPYGTYGTVPYLSHFLHDIEPFLQCCSYSTSNCYWYKCYRPSHECTDYDEPDVATGIGDPHMMMLDGTAYTFNGKGEYLMLQTDLDEQFVLQARTNTLPNSDLPVTVFVAAAAQYYDSDIIHVEISLVRVLDVWVKEQGQEWRLLDFQSSTWYTLNGVSISGNNIEEDGVLVLFHRGVALELKATSGTNRVMSILFVAPQSFREHTTGLLGTWNDNPGDDFTTPAGTVISSDATVEELHYQFGLPWQIDADDSILYYRPRFSPASFRDDTFTPVFAPPQNPNVPEEALAACEGNKFCEFDYLATGDSEVAMATKEAIEEQEAIVEASRDVVICGALDHPVNGDVFVSRASVGGVALYTCIDGYMLMGLDKRVCEGNGEWFGMVPTCVLIPEIGPSSFSLNSSVYHVVENGGSVRIVIHRNGDTQIPGSVRLFTASVTALSPADFTIIDEHIQFDAGVEELERHITITDDNVMEPLKTLEIYLLEAVSSDVGMPNMATIFIEDDEVEHFFKNIIYSVGEEDGQVRLTVSKIGYLGPTTINYVTITGTATSPNDYTYKAEALTFEQDKPTAYIDIPIIDDNIFEDPEQFTVVLQSSRAGQIGDRDTAIVNIESEDKMCSTPCKNGGLCIDKDTCQCSTPFSGQYCEIDTCSPSCENGGICKDANTCQCTASFTGTRCEIAVCSPPCRNGGSCTEGNVCSCPTGFIGSYCERVDCSPPCQNGGMCVFEKCMCPLQFTGSYCQNTATDECSVPGICGGPEFLCVETSDGFRCECTNGHYAAGDLCVLASRIIIGQIKVMKLDDDVLTFTDALNSTATTEYVELTKVLDAVLTGILRFSLPGFIELNIRGFSAGSVLVTYEILLSEDSSVRSEDVLDTLSRSTSPRGVLGGSTVKVDPFFTMIISEICPLNYCSGNGTCEIDAVNDQSICKCNDGYRGQQCLEHVDEIRRDKDFSVSVIVAFGCLLIVIIIMSSVVGFCFCRRVRRAMFMTSQSQKPYASRVTYGFGSGDNFALYSTDRLQTVSANNSSLQWHRRHLGHY